VLSEDFPAQLAWLRAGSLMAGYRLEAQIGAGGMAVVFRARDERLGRLVALKVLAPALASDPGFRRRFIAESRAAAAVDDPHIIPIYEAGEADGALFIAMRFVGGGDLRQVLNREGALSPGRAAGFISPVASALDAAHGAGLVHRDVKPANILVDTRQARPDHVYLSDFGVSKGAISSVSLTGAGHFLGTPDYSAPEQIQGLAVDGRADQYALACVAYQLLTGVVPFERDQGMAVLFAHLSEPPPSLGRLRPGLPAVADAVMARGMAKVPEKRFGSCVDFADALREALGPSAYAALGPDRPSARVTSASLSPDHPPSRITSEQGFSRSVTASTVDWAPNGAAARPVSLPRRPPPEPVGHARKRSRRRWLVPAAVAASIVAVVAAVLVKIAGSGATPAGLVYAEGGRVPPYYVWITTEGGLEGTKPSDAVVRLTATGTVLGTIKPTAPNGTIAAVIGATDDRTFVLDEQPWVNPDNPKPTQAFQPRTFYLLRLGADGKPGSVTRLPITEPSGALVTGVALSPDDTKLAVAVQPDSIKNGPTQVELYSIATGAVLRTWSVNSSIGNKPDDTEALSWISDQTLGFRLVATGSEDASRQGEWLLDLSRGGVNLLNDSRQVTSQNGDLNVLECYTDSIITPDGSSVVCGAAKILPHATQGGEVAFLEYSAASGKVTRTLAHWTIQDTDLIFADVLWSNRSGSALVGTIPATTGGDDVGMITAGTFTTLPGSLTATEENQGAW
jgi:serine/threonine protein kinase